MPKNKNFELILHDAFSPNNCPQLWSEEFLKCLSLKLIPGGRLITYCRAAAIRGSLRRSGLNLHSLAPNPADERSWSNGTLAILSETGQSKGTKSTHWKPLSTMEEDHLLTRAAIPYRDPSGNDTREQILYRRKKEQQMCQLESTSTWQKRWKKVQ